MSIHTELPAFPLELHACKDTRGYYGSSCRCIVNTTVISSDLPFDYLSNTTRSRANDQGIDKKYESGSFVEHFGGVSLTSMPRHQHRDEHLHHRPPYQEQSEWKFGNESRSTGVSLESPFDAASFECSAMLDSAPSSSPASSVSPGSLAPHGNSPIGTHTISNLEILASQHHQQPQQQQQQLCGMNTQQVVNHHNQHNNNHHHHHPHLQRGPKRRAVDNNPVDETVVGNRKERRRTQSINTAFADLRECIPNVPADTKLSKIKTLRLATSYIAYLTDMVSRDDNMNGDMEMTINGMMMEGIRDGVGTTMPMIRQDFSLTCRSIIKGGIKHESTTRNDCEAKRKRNRTGWPEHVWALELQH